MHHKGLMSCSYYDEIMSLKLMNVICICLHLLLFYATWLSIEWDMRWGKGTLVEMSCLINYVPPQGPLYARLVDPQKPNNEWMMKKFDGVLLDK